MVTSSSSEMEEEVIVAGNEGGVSGTWVAKPCGIIAGEQISGSPICPKSGGPRTGDPNEGLQLCPSGQDLQLTLWLLSNEIQSRSPGR